MIAAVAALDADALPARLDALEAAATHHRQERDDVAERLALAREELARLERSDEAARARQEATVLEAEIQDVAERYARARLAQRVLRDAIARFRSAHEGPLLARANQLFPALTCERFTRLETDLDERDRDILVAIRADGSRLRVDQLSDGTREQLFLALRLAAIERTPPPRGRSPSSSTTSCWSPTTSAPSASSPRSPTSRPTPRSSSSPTTATSSTSRR